MKEQIMQNIAAVLGALNSVSVSGKQNLANLSGSIAVLEEVANALENAEITASEKDAGDCSGE